MAKASRASPKQATPADLEIYRQKCEHFRHLDRLRWQAPGITFASGAILLAAFGGESWLPAPLAILLFGMISLLSSFMIYRIRLGIVFNRNVLTKAASRIGDDSIPPMSGGKGATSVFCYFFLILGVAAIVVAIYTVGFEHGSRPPELAQQLTRSTTIGESRTAANIEGGATFQLETLFSGISAMATVIAAVGLFLTVRQLRFNAWLKAQDLFTKNDFIDARGKVFARLDQDGSSWTEEEKKAGMNVCRRMDEFCHLVRFLGKRRVLATWADPIGKAWFLLERFVAKERKACGWPAKWEAFEKIGRKALKRLVSEGRDPRKKRGGA